jgi:hypothetical protein
VLAQILHGFLIQPQDAAGIIEEPFAGEAQFDMRFRAMEQRHADAVFQALDLHAHRRLGAVEGARRAREGAMVGNGDKGQEEVRIEGRAAHNEY